MDGLPTEEARIYEPQEKKSTLEDDHQRVAEQQKKLLAEISCAAAEHGCSVRYPIHHGLQRRRKPQAKGY